MKRPAIFIFFVSLFTLSCFAQIEISTEKEMYNGKMYFVHEVKQGQTVYSISKAYGVTTDEIFEVNSSARDGIKTGQYLRIPISSQHITETVVTGPTDVTNERPLDTLFLISYIAEEDILITQLARIFGIAPELIRKYNTSLDESEIIRKGMTLTVPSLNIQPVVDYVLKYPKTKVIMLSLHIVIKGETLYSIARQYACSVSEVQEYNPGIEEMLHDGQHVWVPMQDIFKLEQHTLLHPKVECLIIDQPKHYNVALLIPFHLDKMGQIVIHDDPKKNMNKNFTSFDYIQFYEGFLLAINAINFNNAKITLSVYDISDGTDQIQRLITKGLLDVDLIIGPFGKIPLTELDTYTKDKNIKIIDLYFPDELDFNVYNPNVISALPSVGEQLKGLLDFINTQQGVKNVVFVYSDNAHEKQLFEKIKSIADSNQYSYVLQYVNYSVSGMSGLVKQMSHDNTNVIINFSSNEVFLNNFMRALFDAAEKIPITLYGLPQWLRYESIDIRYFNHFNTHFFSSHFVDYKDPSTLQFIKSFQETFLTDPNRFAFMGYDVATYFLGALVTYGSDFPYCLSEYNYSILSTDYKFERNTEGGQLQNYHVCVYEMIEFELFNSRNLPVLNEDPEEKK